MRIQKLSMRQFRNYESAELWPDAGITVLCGKNAQGKTNVLEAIHLCCVGRSHRTSHDREMIRWGQSFARARVEVGRPDGTHDVRVTLTQGGKRGKEVRVGGSPVLRMGELMGHVNSVLFSPEDLKLVKEGPGERRRFLDMALSQMRPAYFYALQRYARTLVQRNRLLKELATWETPALRASMRAWDDLMAASGAELIAHRARFLDRLALAAGQAHESLAEGKERLTVHYVSPFAKEQDARAKLRQALEEAFETDCKLRTTTVGPHREEVELLINERALRLYGSQGQQRTAALALKLAVLTVMREELSEPPVLLLDDVMSELDPGRRRMLLEWISDVQTIVTCTDLSDLGGAAYGALYEIDGGSLRQLCGQDAPPSSIARDALSDELSFETEE